MKLVHDALRYVGERFQSVPIDASWGTQTTSEIITSGPAPPTPA